jgi:uncharacterized membrane protein
VTLLVWIYVNTSGLSSMKITDDMLFIALRLLHITERFYHVNLLVREHLVFLLDALHNPR